MWGLIIITITKQKDLNMTPEEIGKLVRKYRRSQNLKQRQLAGVTGVGERFVVELEAGNPTIELGKALKVIKNVRL